MRIDSGNRTGKRAVPDGAAIIFPHQTAGVWRHSSHPARNMAVFYESARIAARRQSTRIVRRPRHGRTGIHTYAHIRQSKVFYRHIVDSADEAGVAQRAKQPSRTIASPSLIQIIYDMALTVKGAEKRL